MRRSMSLIIAIIVLGAYCFAEGKPTEYEIAHEIMTALFASAAGTNTDIEMALREDMTADERRQRNEENAAYREMVLPWLVESLTSEEEAQNIKEQEADGPEAAAEAMLRKERLDAAFEAMGENDEGRVYIDRLRLMGAESKEACLALTRQYIHVWLSQIDPERMEEVNEDFQFWLYSPDSPIDYPVVQTKDNNYYLHRLFNGEYNSAGTLFVDYRNLPELQDPNTLVYGHHMRNDSMFGSLEWYESQSYFESHPYMLLIGEGEIDLIELFAGYTTSKDDECYDIAISDEDDLTTFVEKALKKSSFVCKPKIYTEDRLITMSTCAYAFQNARYIVIGRLLPTWHNEANDGQP